MRKWVGLEEPLAQEISLINFAIEWLLLVRDSEGVWLRGVKRKEGGAALNRPLPPLFQVSMLCSQTTAVLSLG